jgi:hypothetical protein
MLSSVLRSPQAVHLSRKLDALEQRYDEQFRVVFRAIRKLMLPPPTNPRSRIGFRSD